MRRTAIALLLLAAAACAPAEEAATDTAVVMDTAPAAAGLNVADLAGTWVGSSGPAGSPAAANVEMVATGTESGWTINLVNAADSTRRTSTAVRVLSTAGDSVVLEQGPYASVLRPGEQVTVRSVYRLQGNRLVGTSHVTYANGDTTTFQSELTRR